MAENDKVEIINVLNLYGFALDARAWDLFDLIFTQDVEAVFGPAGAGWRGLEEFKRSFEMFHNTLDSHQHTMMGHVVHVDGDAANAFSYGNWLLVREAAEGGPNWTGPAGTTTNSFGPRRAGESSGASADSRAGLEIPTSPNPIASISQT